MKRLTRAWGDLSLRRKGAVVVSIPLLMLVIATGLSVFLARRSDEAESLARHSIQVRADAQRVLRLILDAETGVRGYILSGQSVFLETHHTALSALPAAVEGLENLVAGEPAPQRARVGHIGSLVSRRLDSLEDVMAEGRPGEELPASGVARMNEGNKVMGSLRKQLSAVGGWELRSLKNALDTLHQHDRVGLIAVAGSVLLGLAAGAGALLLFVASICRRANTLEMNASRVAEEKELIPMTPSADEIGTVDRELHSASDLLRERKREVLHALTKNKATEATARRAEKAERADRAKSEFVSRMSHELRTPLHAILGFTHLLQMDDLSSEHRDSVVHIHQAGRHLLELINEVLDVARIESGRLEISSESVIVGAEASEAIQFVRPLAERRHVVLEMRDLSSGSAVMADRQRLKQVFLNLLSNAIKYNTDNGRVSLQCRTVASSSVVISISDTGQGIAAEKMEQLFSPFERLGAERTGVEGTGLGLALSKRLVEMMGGRIWVDSLAGRGTTFHVELPLAPAPQVVLDDNDDDDVSRDILAVAPAGLP